MTPDELSEARQKLGLTEANMARAALRAALELDRQYLR